MKEKLRQILLSIYYFAAGVAVEFARWLARNPHAAQAQMLAAVYHTMAVLKVSPLEYAPKLGPGGREFEKIAPAVVKSGRP